jgi:PBP1b-binding outer membrane lipoprotein LpoB
MTKIVITVLAAGFLFAGCCASNQSAMDTKDNMKLESCKAQKCGSGKCGSGK